MIQVLKSPTEKMQNNFEHMRAVYHAFASNRECSVQQAVYYCLLELQMREVFPSVIYANTNLPEKRFKMLQSNEEISCIPDESGDIFMLDKYMDRPDQSCHNGALNSMHYAEFLRYYYLVSRTRRK